MKILVVEDDRSIAEPLAAGLRRQGYEVTLVATGRDALAATGHDVVLLDLGLPDMDGTDVCRQIRARSDVPIIVVTARGDEVDRVIGLELGADDYVVKPFGFRAERVWDSSWYTHSRTVDVHVAALRRKLGDAGWIETVRGTVITLSARQHGDRIELHVTDQGPGMPAEERRRAFDRFWRKNGSDGDGLGLGLPIVHQPATASGGAVEPRAADGGLDATISLPVATDQPHATGA